MNTKATIDRFEEDKAILILKTREVVIWPKNRLPENSAEGKVISISIEDDRISTENNSKKAKELLNEILNP